MAAIAGPSPSLATAAADRARRFPGRSARCENSSFHHAAAGGAEAAPQFGIAGEPVDGVGKRRGVVRRHQQGVDAVARDLAATRHVGGDDRPPAGGGFQQAHRQALAQRRQHGDMRPRPERADVIDVAEEGQPRTPLPFGEGCLWDRGGIGRIGLAGNQECDRPAAARKQRMGLDQRGQALVGRAAGRRSRRRPAAAAPAAASARRCRRRIRESARSCRSLTPSDRMAARSSGFCTSTKLRARRSSHRSSGTIVQRRSMAFGVREVKAKPRPARALRQTTGSPIAASEPTTVGSKAT